MKALHFQFRKQIGVMIITLINIQTSIKLYSKSFSNCLMKHFHTGIHWDIKKWGWYNQQRLDSIQYWLVRLCIMLIFFIYFLPYLLQSIDLTMLFSFYCKLYTFNWTCCPFVTWCQAGTLKFWKETIWSRFSTLILNWIYLMNRNWICMKRWSDHRDHTTMNLCSNREREVCC